MVNQGGCASENLLEMDASERNVRPIELASNRNNREDSTYQVVPLEEILEKMVDPDNEGFQQDYVPISEPINDETGPAEYFEEYEEEPDNVCQPGDITKLLREMPNCMPSANSFPATYVPPKPRKQPDAIYNDKIPILLHEKYFKFSRRPTDDQQYQTVYDSDEDNASVQCDSPRASTSNEQKPINGEGLGEGEMYYNPFQIYMMKRGKDNARSNNQSNTKHRNQKL